MERQNITLSLPKALLKKAKMAAVRKDKSLSEFLKDALEESLTGDTEYRKAQRRQAKMLETGLDMGTGGNLSISRAELHERR